MPLSNHFSTPSLALPQCLRRAVVAIALATGSCADSSIESRGYPIDPRVEQGTAYDRTSLELGTVRTIVLPDDTVVRRSDMNGTTVDFFMAKDFSWGGHTDEQDKPTTLDEGRKEMGLAKMLEPNQWVIATVGEWSNMEGGASIKCVAIVPIGVEVHRRVGLSGPHHLFEQQQLHQIADRPSSANNSFGLPTGWTMLADVRDPNRTAK